MFKLIFKLKNLFQFSKKNNDTNNSNLLYRNIRVYTAFMAVGYLNLIL